MEINFSLKTQLIQKILLEKKCVEGRGDTKRVGNYLEHGAVLTWQNPIKATHFFNSPREFL